MYPMYSRARIVAAYQSGDSADLIAGMLGISPNTVYRELRRAGVKRRSTGKRPGKWMPMAQRLYEQGELSIAEIARRVGMSKQRTWEVLRG